MASKSELRALITLAGKVDPSLQASLIKTTQNTEKLSRSLKDSTQYASRFSEMLSASFLGNVLADAVSTVTGKVIELGREGIQLASSLGEVQNIVDTTFSASAKQVDEWANTTLDAYGVTELQAKQWSGTMGAMLKSSGMAEEDMLLMSTTLAGLAGDFASFHNLDHEEAWRKIRSGIAGESEPLRELGYDLSATNVEAYALSKGITQAWKDMSNADQAILRYNYLLETSTDAQGDYGKTSESFANQQRLLGTNFQELSATIAGAFLPSLTELLIKANEFIKGIDMVEVVRQVEEGIRLAADAFRWLGDHMNILIPVAASVLGIMAGYKIMTVVSSLIKGVTVATQFLCLAKLKEKTETLYLMGLYAKDVIAKGISSVATWAMVTAQGALNGIIAIGTGVMSAFGAVLAFITSPIGLVILAIGALIAVGVLLWKNWEEVSTWMVGIWQDYVMPFFSGIGEWFSGIWTGMVDGFKFAWNGIVEWFSGLWEGITSVFTGFVNIYINIFNSIIGAINSIKLDVPDWVPLIGGQSIGVTLPTLPTFALGGIATQASIFGEAGPEMAIPLNKSPRSYDLLNQTAQLLGVPSGAQGKREVTINVNVNGGSNTPGMLEDFKNAVKQAIREIEDEEEVVCFG